MEQIILNYEELMIKNFQDIDIVNFIEIGSERGHGSTKHHAHLCDRLNYNFITVDADDLVADNALKIVKAINEDFEAINMTGEEFLKNYKSEIHILYLDAFDLEHMTNRLMFAPGHPGMTAEHTTHNQYKKRNVALTNTNCHRAHLDMATHATGKMAKNGLVFFDDVYTGAIESDPWSGKGKTAIPYMLSENYTIIDYTYPQLLLQTPN